jgi:hypothetical protein
MIPILNLKPDQELSADQIVRVANGKLQLVTDDGEKAGILLQHKDRPLFNGAITLGYLKRSRKQTRLAEAFCCWCDAKEVPCVSFEIENDCVDILSTNNPVELEQDDTFVTMHFDVATAGRPFTKKGLVAVAELLLGKLWGLSLSPWKISAGVLPLSHARQIMADVHKVWDTTSDPKSESGLPSGEELQSSAPHTIH